MPEIRRRRSLCNRFTALAATIGFAALPLSIAACGGSAGSGGGGASTGTVANSAASDSKNPCAKSSSGPIKIGVTGPESGLYAIVGQSQETGLQIAIQSLGSKGINGRKVVMENKDDAFSPTTAVSNFQQFVNSDGICAMVGPTDTSSTLAVAQADGQLPTGPIPQIGTLGADNVIAPNGPGTKPRAYAFGVLTGNWPELTILTKYVLSHFKGQKIGIIHDPTAYGQDQASFAIKLLKQRGIKPVADESLPVNTPDPTPQVNKVLAAGATVVYSLVSYDDVARVAKSLRAQGSKAQVICTDQCAVIPDFIKNAGAAANGTISTKAAGTALPPTPALRAFGKKYNALTHTSAFPPPDWAMTTYDAAQMLFSVWKKVGTDPDKVFAALQKIHDWKGLSCPSLSFSATQHNAMGETDCYRMMIIKNQKAVLLPGQGS